MGSQTWLIRHDLAECLYGFLLSNNEKFRCLLVAVGSKRLVRECTEMIPQLQKLIVHAHAGKIS